MKIKHKIIPAVTAMVAVTVVICAIVIVSRQMGIVDGYDFGAGAYYYADIPGYETIFKDEVYSAEVPVWMHVALFLGWGWLMWRLWCWIDRRNPVK